MANPTATPVTNFGWPCYEGSAIQPSYQAANLNMCTSLYNNPGSVTAPYYQYNHGAKVVANETCPTAAGSSITGVAFYPTSGGTFPAAYNGALFFADYTRNCIWAMQVGTNGLPDPTKIVTFEAPATQPVDLAVDPNTHDLFYADLEQGTAGAGSIHRISFQGTGAPVAKITTNPSPAVGAAPLPVSFDGTGRRGRTSRTRGTSAAGTSPTRRRRPRARRSPLRDLHGSAQGDERRRARRSRRRP